MASTASIHPLNADLSSPRSSTNLASSSSTISSAISTDAPLPVRFQQTNARIIELLDTIAAEPTSRNVATPVRSTSSTSTSSIASCRPFDREAYLAYVRTYSPLVWQLKPSPLDPLTLAHHGWICSSELNERDTIFCRICATRQHCHFAPAVLASIESSRQLAERYFASLHHTSECPWHNEVYEDNFRRILPRGVPHESAVWIAMNQVQRRESSLAAVRICLTPDFLTRFEKELRSHDPTCSQLPSLHATLAMCGWEIRESDTSAAADSSAPILQCWFGCRDAHVAAFSYTDEIAPMVDESEEKERRLESKYDDEPEEEEEERSIFQSPIKRRRVDSAPITAAAASPSSYVPIRANPAGFDPLRSHRPFCPFVQPLPIPDPTSPSAASHSSALDSSPLGWQLIVQWWSKRQQQASQHQQTNVAHTDEVAIMIDIDGENKAPLPPPVMHQPNKKRQYESVVSTVRHLLSSALAATRSVTSHVVR